MSSLIFGFLALLLIGCVFVAVVWLAMKVKTLADAQKADGNADPLSISDLQPIYRFVDRIPGLTEEQKFTLVAKFRDSVREAKAVEK